MVGQTLISIIKIKLVCVCPPYLTGPIVIGIVRGGQAAYRAYRAWKLAQAMQNEIGDD